MSSRHSLATGSLRSREEPSCNQGSFQGSLLSRPAPPKQTSCGFRAKHQLDVSMRLAAMCVISEVSCLPGNQCREALQREQEIAAISALRKHGSCLSRAGTASGHLGDRPTAHVCTTRGRSGSDWVTASWTSGGAFRNKQGF